jgi:hypothetical protein
MRGGCSRWQKMASNAKTAAAVPEKAPVVAVNALTSAVV